MTRSIIVRDMPAAWFKRPQYRPTVHGPAGEAWFVLSPSFRPPEEVPTTAPREPPAGRARLRLAFEETYSSWKLTLRPETRRSIEMMAQHGTAAVVTGQQPGFLGGPLHTLYKALGTIAAARRYTALTGRPCVPVFWVAGDDHDFEEVREVWVPAPGGEAAFRFPGEADRRPISDHAVGPEAEPVLAEAERHFGERRFGADARALVQLYRGRSLASGFAAIVAELLGHTGLLVLDPLRARPLAQRIFRGVLEEPTGVLQLVEQGRAEVAAKGIEPVVAARLPLFIVRDKKRHHLSPSEGGLRIDGGGPEVSTQEALQVLARDPGAFSQGALLRPIVQEECLPCVLAVGGPAEVGYFAQIGPLARHFGFDRPSIALRLNATIADGKAARTAKAVGLERLSTALTPEELLAPDVEPESLEAVRALAADAGRVLLRAVGELVPPPESARMTRRARDAAADLAALADRIAKSRLVGRTQELEDAKRLWAMLLPQGALQERRWGFIHFVAKHGREWIQELLERIEPQPLRIVHRWIEFDGPGNDLLAPPAPS